MTGKLYFFCCCICICASTPLEWTPDPLCPYPSFEPFRFPCMGDCTKYYECLGGTKTLLQCPDNFVFDASLQRCDSPGVAHCDPDHISTVTWSPIVTTPQPICTANGDQIIYFPYVGDCSKYWECYQGQMYVHQCPVGYEWNSVTETCDLDSNVDCPWEK